MNLSNTMGLSPNSFRRVLTLHGRTTTPGLLECPMTPKLESPKRKSNDTLITPEHETSTDGKEAEARETEMAAKFTAYQANNIQKARDMINLPVSKSKADNPISPTDSYSFYKRPFRVHGKEAWEYAMRDLGSIDTLLNRYGYVEPEQRLDIPQSKNSQIGNNSVASVPATVAAAADPMK